MRKSLQGKKYTYKNKPYMVLYETKMKISELWVNCIVYQCLYYNPDGGVWVRERQQFLKLFKPFSKKVLPVKLK